MVRDNENKRERERVAREIARTSEAIRRKHRALKTGRIDEDIAVKSRFDPIIEPLRKIADSSGTRAIKNEPREIGGAWKRDEDEEEEEEEEEGSDGDNAIGGKRKRTPQSDTATSIGRETWHDISGVSPITSTPLASKQPTTSTPRAAQSAASSPPPLAVKQPIADLESEDVFKTTEDSLATIIRNKLQTKTGQEAMWAYLGSLSRKYIGDVLSGDPDIDNAYGVRLDKIDNELKLGNKRFDVDGENNIIIDNVRYAGTRGIYELIFKRIPDVHYCTKEDKQKYKSILLATSAHRLNNDPTRRIKGNPGYKYKEIIKPLFAHESAEEEEEEEKKKKMKRKAKSGKGLPRAMTLDDRAVDYVHWDDPNELVDRLRLLDASRRAGNDAHDNEILSIVEELREAGIVIN